MSTTVNSVSMQCAYCLMIDSKIKVYTTLESFRRHLKKHDSNIRDHQKFARETKNISASVKMDSLTEQFAYDYVFKSPQKFNLNVRESRMVLVKEKISIPKTHIAFVKNTRENIEKRLDIQSTMFTNEDEILYCIITNMRSAEIATIEAGEPLFTLKYVLSTNILYVK